MHYVSHRDRSRVGNIGRLTAPVQIVTHVDIGCETIGIGKYTPRSNTYCKHLIE